MRKEKIYVILNNEHMLAHSSVTEDLLMETIPKVSFKGTKWMGTISMGRVIGESKLVAITSADDVREELRPGRRYPSRIVYGRRLEKTELLTIGLCIDSDDGLCTVFTAFPGPMAPKELMDPSLSEEERQEAEAFWRNHALCV